MDLYSVRNSLSSGITLTDMNLRVTYYARVSTNHLEQEKSLKNQKEHFEQYIKNNPNWTYIDSYIDDGITGTSDVKRSNFMKMIKDARNKKFDLIITKEISRFSRNTLDSIKYTRELLSYGVAVLFVNDNINTALPDSELRLTIMASMAQDEIRRLSERVKFGMNRAIERGEILGNNLLFGYRKDKDTKNLVIVEEEAKIVRRIYELYAIDKLSINKIAKILNKEHEEDNKSWCISTISRMIENPKYKGYYCAKKSEIVDYMSKKVKYFDKEKWIIYEDKKRIPPIVDEYLWLQANNRLTKRKMSMQKNKKTNNKYKDRYTYSAKIYCKKHGTPFHRRIFRKQKKDITWICSEYLKHGKTTCNTPNIREKELEEIFKDLIKTLKIDLSKSVEKLEKCYESHQLNDGLNEKVKKIEKKLATYNLKKDKLLELNFQEIISNQELNEKNQDINKKIKELQENLINLKKESKIKSRESNDKNELYELIKLKSQSINTYNKVVSIILDKIVVSKINNSKGNIHLDIFLTYNTNTNEINKTSFLKKDYSFKRGYDTTRTKRYTITYEVNYYL